MERNNWDWGEITAPAFVAACGDKQLSCAIVRVGKITGIKIRITFLVTID